MSKSKGYRPDVTVVALDGPPGSGKTTKLVRDSHDWPVPWAIVTYSKDAAKTLHSRGVPQDLAGTIYSLAWPHVKKSPAGVSTVRTKLNTAPAYRSRAMRHSEDAGIDQYLRDAPSKNPADPRLEELHAWDPTQGDPPDWVWDKPPKGTSFAVSLARWLAQGAPLVNPGYKFIAIDEAQDLSALELAASLALLRPGGECLAVGDPGQAIHLGNKGWPDALLPPAWLRADRHEGLKQGYRMGLPATQVASDTLAPYYDRPASYFTTSAHATNVHLWDTQPPLEDGGLILGWSRRQCVDYCHKHGLAFTGLVPNVRDSVVTVCTIAAAKGHEADSVFLLPWSEKWMSFLSEGDPSVLKIAYVALTRARFNLHLPAGLYARLV